MANSQGSQKILTLAVVFAFIIISSLFLGSAVGQQDTGTVMIAVTVIILVAMFAGLGKHVWIVVPLFVSWSGSVPILPLPFSVSNLAVGFACTAWVLMLATRKIQSTYRLGMIDGLIFITLMLLVLGYFRNPVGVAAIRSGANVGARPYVVIVIATVGYLMLASQRPKLEVVAALPKWSLISAAAIGIGGTIAYFLPAIGIYMYQFYTGFKPNVGAILDPTAVSESVGRAGFLRPFALAGVAYVGARCFPMKALTPRQWGLALLLMIGTVLALLSGFRGTLVAIGFYFVFACWLWKRMAGVMACVMIGLIGIMLLIGIQQAVPLPERVQRTLSFLPGDWDQDVMDNAENSVEWRVEMWETVLTGDSISNWYIGDGFGFPRSELEYFTELYVSGAATPDQLATYFIITGGLHSGPLSAAKFVGIFGFVLYMVLAIVIAYRFVKLWGRIYRYGESRPLHVTVGFFAIQAAYLPLKFVFIFGAYNNDLAPLILSAGVLRLMETACHDHFQEISRAEGGPDTQIAEAV